MANALSSIRSEKPRIRSAASDYLQRQDVLKALQLLSASVTQVLTARRLLPRAALAATLQRLVRVVDVLEYNGALWFTDDCSPSQVQT